MSVPARLILATTLLACAPLCSAQLAETPLAEDLQAPATDAPARPLDLSALAADLTPPEQVGDGRRTMKLFVPNLGRNLVGFFSPANARPLLFGAALAGAGSRFDQSARAYFVESPRARSFGQAGATLGGSTVMGPATIAMFFAGRASRDSRFRALTYDGMQATLVAGTYTSILKHAVGRNRPDASSDLSFPSGHTSQAFAWATVVDHHYGRKAGLAAYATAGLIGVSRMERNKHYLSDVLAGATIGWVSGRTVTRRNGESPREGRRLELAPMTDPSGSGVGLGVHISF